MISSWTGFNHGQMLIETATHSYYHSPKKPCSYYVNKKSFLHDISIGNSICLKATQLSIINICVVKQKVSIVLHVVKLYRDRNDNSSLCAGFEAILWCLLKLLL